ncbi:caspase family protein, partial [Mycolicibacterium alvei]
IPRAHPSQRKNSPDTPGRIRASPAMPGTHALIVGVGGYPHLEGGTGTPIEDPLQYGNLGQLTSPPRSALAFANWLCQNAHERWKAPLASVDMLISPSPADPSPAGLGMSFHEPTIAGIRTAWESWMSRCSTNPGNVAVFYFCGHGLQSTEQILLASDFGQFDNHFVGAFGFESSRYGFLQHPPQTQCFFIDACRGVTPGVVEKLGSPTVLPLVTLTAYKKRQCEHDLTLQSSAPFQSAFGPIGAVSHFTAALICAFEGGAATTDEYGDWVIRTERVSARIDDLLEAQSGRRQPTAKGPGLASTVLYRLDAPPDVKLTLGCDPRLALDKATLFYKPDSPPRAKRIMRTPPASVAWELTVRGGYYTVGASFADSTFEKSRRGVLLEPPFSPQVLRVRPK